MPWRTSIATRGVPTTNDPALPWGGARYLADNSVWQRTDKPAIRDLWAAALRNDQIATCPINRAEILWSARNLANFDQICRTLGALDNYELRQDHWDAAEAALRRLTEIGQHRAVQPPDLLLAAVAATNDLAILHYDSDFDLLREKQIFAIRT